MDFQEKAEEIYNTITTSWEGSQMLWPIQNKRGDTVNVVFHKDDTLEGILKRLQLWYSHESKMIFLEIKDGNTTTKESS